MPTFEHTWTRFIAWWPVANLMAHLCALVMLASPRTRLVAWSAWFEALLGALQTMCANASTLLAAKIGVALSTLILALVPAEQESVTWLCAVIVGVF